MLQVDVKPVPLLLTLTTPFPSERILIEQTSELPSDDSPLDALGFMKQCLNVRY
jgi:hypothetical protein